MARVLVLSHTTGYQLRAFNDAAEQIGIELVFATDRCHKLDDPWQDRAVPVRFHELSASVHAIVERHQQLRLDGLIAVGDRPVVLAASAADAIGIPWHPVSSALASIDKSRSRAALAAGGLPTPQFSTLDPRVSADDAAVTINGDGFEFPIVLKPVGLSGSRGVIRANDERECAAAVIRIRALLSRPEVRAARTGLEDSILVERYIDGREFAVEGVLTHGVLKVFALFDKPDPLEGPYFEETIYVMPAAVDPALQSRIVEHVARGAEALGLRHGPIHAECRVTAGGDVFVLEIAARPIGGLCSRVLTLVKADAWAAGNPESSLEEVLLRHAIGESPAAWEVAPHAAAVMMIPIPARGVLRGVDGAGDARAVPGVTDVRITAKVGQLLETLPEAGSYLGFIFGRASTARAAERAVREAHGKLNFEIAREIAVNRESRVKQRSG